MITLEEGQFGWDYVIEHDDGDSILIQSDWDYPATASTFGWEGPCSGCQRYCKGATDGTVDCAEHTALEFIMNAQVWLDLHIGATTADPGYFN